MTKEAAHKPRFYSRNAVQVAQFHKGQVTMYVKSPITYIISFLFLPLHLTKETQRFHLSKNHKVKSLYLYNKKKTNIDQCTLQSDLITVQDYLIDDSNQTETQKIRQKNQITLHKQPIQHREIKASVLPGMSS